MMIKDKFIVGLVVIILLLLAVGLIWFKVYVSTPHYLIYHNSLQGYSVLIPAWWGKNYDVLEEDNGAHVNFIFKSVKEEPYLLFSIVKTTPTEWEQLKKDSQKVTVSRWLARRENDVFYAYWLPNNPYRGQESGKYLAMARDLTSVFNSFSLAVNSESLPQEQEQSFCIQVITTAKELVSGQIKEFSTPCEVPAGWEIISPLQQN